MCGTVKLFHIKNSETPDDIYVKTVIQLFGFYGISTIIGYLIPNPFLYK